MASPSRYSSSSFISPSDARCAAAAAGEFCSVNTTKRIALRSCAKVQASGSCATLNKIPQLSERLASANFEFAALSPKSSSTVVVVEDRNGSANFRHCIEVIASAKTGIASNIYWAASDLMIDALGRRRA